MRKRNNEMRREAVWVWAVVFAFALMIAGAWVVFDEIFAPLDAGGEVVLVPDYTGMPIDGISVPSWIALEREYRYDADVPAGEVISQSPVGGSRKKVNDASGACRVTLTVSLGVETVLLPNVLSQSVQQAESSLRAAGFAVDCELVTGAYPEGEVFDMSPKGGVEMPKGSRVKLFVSAGTPTVTVLVPDVRGMSRGDALTTLWLSRLSVAEVIEVESDEDAGIVVRQNYQPNTVVMAGTKLTLYVSRQKEF